MVKGEYQYGTNPRKIDPYYKRKTTKKQNIRPLKVIENKPKQQTKISKKQKKQQNKMIATVCVIFALLLTISCRNSQIDKKFNQIQEQKSMLASLQKENEQLKVSIENSLNLSNIEKVAKEQLGMQKLNANQTIYVTLPKKDYVESASEKVIIEEQESLWNKIIDKILNF